MIALLICFTGLKCYVCDDMKYYHPNMDPEQTGAQLCERTKLTSLCPSKFCLTHKFNDCDNRDACFEKDCDWWKVCKSVGWHETEHPITGDKFVVDCCQGDLCNAPDKPEENLLSNQSKLSSYSGLLYVLFSTILLSVFVLF